MSVGSNLTLHSKMQNVIQSKTKYIFKAILFCSVFIVLFIGFTATLNFLPRYLVSNNFIGLYRGIIGIVVGLLTTKLFLRIDKKTFADIELTWRRNTVAKFFKGGLIGLIIMGFFAGSVIYFTNARIEISHKSNLSQFLLASVPVFLHAFMEELGFRAYPLQILTGKVGIRIAIIITSLLFALSHIVMGWTVTSAFGPAIWGLLFGLSAIYSKGIAMPTGIHYAINLTTSAFGEENSTVSIWTIKQSGSTTANYLGIDWATILPAFILLVVAIICIELYIKRKTTANIGIQ